MRSEVELSLGTPLQFLALKALDSHPKGMPSKALHAEVAAHDMAVLRPAFSAMVARMIKHGLVDGEWVQIKKGAFNTRNYQITAAGRKALKKTREFYAA